MKPLPNARPIGIDELPAYSSWMPYLLGLKTLSLILDKTAESMLREYGQDKWGVLLEKLKAAGSVTVADADRLSVGENKTAAFYADGELYVADTQTIQSAYFELIRTELQPSLEQFGHLVELGAGYGALLFKLAALPGLEKVGYTAGEYTDTGVACIDLLAAGRSLKLETGYCDLSDLDLKTFAIPEQAVFMTCWTMAYLKGFSRVTLDEIICHKPAVVIHIEPIYEHWSDDSLLQMLWKRYFQLNDYNQSMLTVLKGYEADGLIEILEERRNLFGNNPLAPVSIVKWKPRGG
jgi:hypothetical protein